MNYLGSLWKFVLAIGGFLGIVITALEFGVKLKVTRWAVPDWILLVAIVLLLAAVGHTAYFVSRVYRAVGIGKPKKLELDSDTLFLLTALAAHKDRSARREVLSTVFKRELPDKGDADFNIAIDKLHQSGCVAFSRNILGEEYVSIVSPGYKYVEALRRVSKAQKK